MFDGNNLLYHLHKDGHRAKIEFQEPKLLMTEMEAGKRLG
jgi:hypothetical protein